MNDNKKNYEDFLAAMFGETKVNDIDKSAEDLANILYTYYCKFIVAGFPEDRAFQLCVVILQKMIEVIFARKSDPKK